MSAAGWVNLQIAKQLPADSQFQSKWEVTRELIFNGENPYGSTSNTPFTAPLPVVLLYAPFALIKNYDIARAAWMTALQSATILCAFLCIQITSWQTRGWLAGVFLLFALLWYPAISVYLRGSETAITVSFLIAALFALHRENDEIAGVLLIFAALQPRVTLIGILLVLFWASSQRRWLLHFWAGITLVFISGISLIFIPSWLIDYFWAVLRNVDFSIGGVIIGTTTRWWPGVGEQIGWGIVILMSLILIIEWWLSWGKDEKRLVWTLALTLIFSLWIGIEINVDNLFLLILSLAVIFTAWNRRWGKSGQIFTMLSVIILLPGLWWAFMYFEQQGIPEEINPILMIGFPFIVIIGLYWVRWWFQRPEYLRLSNTY
jgi:hypothetical protein